MFTTALLLSFIWQFGGSFHLKKITPGLKIFFKKPIDWSNSILVMKKLRVREVLPLVKQSHRPRWWHKWDKNRTFASRSRYSFRWFPIFNSLMKSGSRPTSYMSLPYTIPPATVIFPLILGSHGPFLFISWNRTPHFRCFSGYVMISPPQHIKQCQLHTMTTRILAQWRHSPNATAEVGVISYPLAPRRIWEPIQGREGHRLKKEKDKNTSAQPDAWSQNLKTTWLAILWELRGDLDRRMEVQRNKPKCLQEPDR